MGEAAIQVIDVTKSFGATVAVREINLAVEAGEFFSFLGPSGCGKTTLLRMIAGFESPTNGQIVISGKDMIKIPAHKRPVNMVFQSYALFPHLTVIENICFGLKSTGKLPKSEMSERAKRALSLVRLEHLSDRYPAQLSGGQQQRIALARAVVNEPAVLLLDEPLSALDPQIREEMQGELARLQRELNMTFIMVTHDQSEALALSHRVGVFCQGNLEQVGNPEQIYVTPRTQFVARFIGQSNLFPCVYRDTVRGIHSVQLPDGTVLSTSSASHLQPVAAQACLLCVKPQAVSVFSETEWAAGAAVRGDVVNTMRGRVQFASYKGTSTEYFIEVGEHTIRADRPHGGPSVQFAVGDQVVITFSTDAGWLLEDRAPVSMSGSQDLTLQPAL